MTQIEVSVTEQDHAETARIGTFSLVFFVLAAAAPLTILAGFIPLGMLAGGDAIVPGFIIPGLVYLLFAVGFTTLARHVKGDGAFYSYISEGLGRRVGAAAGSMAYLGYLGGQIGFTAAAGVFAGFTVQTFTGISLPWIVYALLFAALAFVLAYRQVTVGARTVAVLLIAEMLILVVFCVGVLAAGGHQGLSLHSLTPEVVFSSALPGVFVLTFTAFVGFEQTAIYHREARNPRRTVPRATYIAVLVLAVGYSFCTWVILQAVGADRMASMLADDPSTLVFRLSDEFLGPAVTSVMLVLMITSFFAGILALQNACARYLLSLGKHGIMPAAFAKVSPTTQSPSTAGIFQGCILIVALVVFALLGSDPYTQIIPWTNTPTIVAVMIMQVLTSLAAIVYFRRNTRGERVWNRLVAPVLASVALLAALVLLIAQMSALTLLDAGGNAIVLVPLLLVALAGALRHRSIGRKGSRA